MLGRDPNRESSEAAVWHTWELELLLSGAVTFALLQLPDSLDNGFARLEPHLSRDMGMGAFVVYLYAKFALLTLIAAFLLHLTSRAYWVALIGLDSVFPGGIRWDRSSIGPLFKDVYRERMRPLKEAIRRADSFASVLFSLAFAAVSMFVFSILVIPPMLLVGAVLARYLLDGEHVFLVGYGIVMLFLLPGMVASTVDKYWGSRLDPDGRASRLIRSLARYNFVLSGMSAIGSVWMTLGTNLPKRLNVTLFVLSWVALTAIAVGDMFVSRGLLRIGSAEVIPSQAAAFGVEPRYYESMRARDAVFPNAPSIPDDVIRGPYVRLFLPYEAEDVDEAIDVACPGLEPFGTGILHLRKRSTPPPPDDQIRRALDCMRRFWTVSLNGQVLDPVYRFYRHPRTAQRGLVAYLPTADLPQGENVLVVEEVEFEEHEEGHPPIRHYISFWR